MTVQIKRGQVLGVLSMTPMIDVVFLLLIFFLVASRLSQEDREMDVPLPSAANAAPMTEIPQELVVNIDRQGTIFINQQAMTRQQFERFMRSAITDNPLGQSVIIRADRQVPLQVPVFVMDTCLELGASYSLSIADEEP